MVIGAPTDIVKWGVTGLFRMSGRPLDVLEAALGDRVRVHLKTGTEYVGELAGYDQHMNLVLEEAERTATSETTPANGDEETSSQDTTIIRGDNVVSINP
ncbi:small nuclear ribonucleoprotein [Halovivax ruber XH-70]|uniref:Small nuclear ribonucleoprotein n=2 Tax=Halovivax ruber TaxID=387341 RepID=L0IA76_HALRX|nr:small nuclear ribonucleoprotein [Halovivax ruber XH-70]